ncbi:MAG TPA: ThuA domain-containing protein [Candidatus Sulfotelmatobacter sp.]|nr:ThuA domain-containing protein [Candidatus Sulfotelmatobacter sp.]
MTLRRFLQFLLIAIHVAGSPSFGQQARFRVLAFYSDKTEPDHVQFANDAVKFLSERAAREHFTLEATTRWEDLNNDRLKDYQLVIWLNESPTNPAQRSAFERYMQSGGAWLGFHAAAYNDRDTNWPWFVDFLGGAVFHINSWPPLPARLVIDDPTHPVAAQIPVDLESPANEWYIWKPSPRLNKDVRVLATFDPANYPIGFKDVLTAGDLPVVWTNTKYSMLYINMGHGEKIFTSPLQNQFIDNAVNWLGTGAKQPARPQNRKQRATLQASGFRINPNGIVLNPQTGKFYAVNTGEDVVTVLDPDGQFLARVPVGKEPESIAVNPETNRVYVANGGSGNVSVIDGATQKLITNVPVGDLPYTLAVNRETNKVYLSRTFSNVTVVVDGKTNIARTLKAGAGDAVAAESMNTDTYLINYEAPQVTAFDGTNDHVSKIEASSHLWALSANPATKKIYAVSAGSASVTVIDGKSRSTRLLKAGEIPCAVTVDSSSARVFVANYASSSVTVIDGVSNSVLTTLKVSPRPQAIAVDSSNHRVYVASMHGGRTTILDGANNSVLSTLETGKAPFAIAVNSKTHKAVVLGLEGDLTVIDGTSFVTSSPSIPGR